jgi:putative serine/threonine protein kinase
MNKFIPINEAKDTPVGSFLCWPVYDGNVFDTRLAHLRDLGVESIALGGPHTVMTKPILGKGHAGVVIRAMYSGFEVALKCMRTDVNRTMEYEARILGRVNEVGLGPKLFGFSEDFLVMEKIEGLYFGDWTKENMDNPGLIRDYVLRVMDIAYRLDMAGVDHGELTKIRRHYIVTGDGPRVIDFDSGSLGRVPQNLTATVQSLFMQTTFARTLGEVYPMPDREELIAVLRRYKENQGEESYRALLDVVR